MADKGVRGNEVPNKPLTMKLFATWEVEKATPNCIPRLCSLTLTRLVILKPLEASDLQSVIIAVKMQNTKRTLRSNDIIVPPSGELDTELHLSFSLQYPHFLKQDGNKLQVMLQRRKKYKNRPILGFKTLAIGQINMAQVLQCSVDRELSLYSEPTKEGATSSVVAQVAMLALTSQPVDHEENGRQKLLDDASQADRSPDVDVSEDDPDYSSNDEMSDSEPDGRSPPFRPASRQRRNIKQKFIALLRRFRMSEEVLDSEQDSRVQGHNQEELEDLFDELENLSESDPELDNISVLSTPKPKLRPFFTGRGSSELLDLPCPPSLAYEFNRLHNEGLQQSKRYDSDTNLENTSGEEPGGGQGSSSDGGGGPGGGSGGITGSPSLRSTASSSKYYHQPLPASTSLPLTTTNNASLTNSSSSTTTPPTTTSTSVSNQATPDEARKALLEQLSHILSPADEVLPDSLVLVNNHDGQATLISQLLKDTPHSVLSTCSSADVKAVISCVVNKIQKLRHGSNFLAPGTVGCNTNSRSPSPIKIAIAGSDSYVNSVLAPYVEQFSNKSPDWQNYIKFLIIPLGSNTIAKFLSLGDAKYSAYFNDQVWRDMFDQKSENTSQTDMAEYVKRICEYVSSASHLVHLPIAEAMLTCRDKSTEEDSSQIFVPFLNTTITEPLAAKYVHRLCRDHRVVWQYQQVPQYPPFSPSELYIVYAWSWLSQGQAHVGTKELSMATSITTSDVEECAAGLLSSSPPLPSHMPHDSTPPNSPNVNVTPASTPGHIPGCSPSLVSELLDLQVDYWTVCRAPDPAVATDKSDRLVKKDSKSSLKTTFRSVQVYRLPQSLSAMTGGLGDMLSMTVTTKEKKQKILRMGKKSKEADTKSQVIEGISRLICTSKSQNQPLTVSIDSIEWVGVKFFQISAQWQTHIKHFPLLTFGDEMHL